MARQSYVYRDGKLIPKHLAGPHPLSGRPAGRGAHVIRDEMEPMKSMLDGKLYTSKRRYEAHVRSRGHDIVGNDTHYLTRPGEMPDTSKSIDRVLQKTAQQFWGA